MMEHFANLYIEDIKGNLERFHPLYIPEVWETVVNQEECNIVRQKAKGLLESRYYEKKLHGYKA